MENFSRILCPKFRLHAPEIPAENTLRFSIVTGVDMPLTIRQASLEDLDVLADIEHRAFLPNLYTSLTKRHYRHLLTKGNADILIALLEGKPCGMAVLLYRKGSSLARFYSLSVDPDYQGKGVGTVLFSAAEKTAQQKNLKGMILEIRSDNIQLWERYKKLGYALSREVLDYYPDGQSCIKMKRLFS